MKWVHHKTDEVGSELWDGGDCLGWVSGFNGTWTAVIVKAPFARGDRQTFTTKDEGIAWLEASIVSIKITGEPIKREDWEYEVDA